MRRRLWLYGGVGPGLALTAGVACEVHEVVSHEAWRRFERDVQHELVGLEQARAERYLQGHGLTTSTWVEAGAMALIGRVDGIERGLGCGRDLIVIARLDDQRRVEAVTAQTFLTCL